jgi:hypothetical protein
MSQERNGEREGVAANGEGRRVDLLFAYALACIYLALASGHLHSSDGILMYRQAESLVFDGSLIFQEPVGPLETSKYGIGLSLVYVPGIVMMSWLRNYMPRDVALVPPDAQWAIPFYGDPLYTVVGTLVHVLIGVASAYFVARVIRLMGGGDGASLWGMALYGLASPALVYARGDWSQSLTGLLWIGGLYLAALYRRVGGMRYLYALGFVVFYTVITRPVEGALLAVVVVLWLAPNLRYLKWAEQEQRVARFVAVGFMVGMLVTVLVNWGRYGSPAVTGYEGVSYSTPPWVGIPGALISPGRGILWEFPALALAPLGFLGVMRGEHRRLGLALVGLAALQLLNVALWFGWWGGWNFGLRLFVPALPLLAVFVGLGVGGLRPAVGRWVPAVLLVAGLVWCVPAVVSDINNGYAERYDTSAANFRLEAYLPVGGWPYFDRWVADGVVDFRAADVLWLRAAGVSSGVSVGVMGMLLVGGGVIAALAVREARSRGG